MKTILIAEDDSMVRDLIKDIIANGGYKPLDACDGQEGWEKLVAQGADMAVLDVNMPRLDGLGLAARIRSDARFADMPILMLSVRGLVEDQLSGYGRGVDDYLTKPFDESMLLARLKVLERRIIGH